MCLYLYLIKLSWSVKTLEFFSLNFSQLNKLKRMNKKHILDFIFVLSQNVPTFLELTLYVCVIVPIVYLYVDC